METLSKSIPANSNSPEWQRYQEDLQRHEQFIKDYRFFLDRITRHLEWVQTRPINKAATWTTDEIREIIGNEIDKAHSMDAPNKPGYYRANND